MDYIKVNWIILKNEIKISRPTIFSNVDFCVYKILLYYLYNFILYLYIIYIYVCM